MKYLKIRQIYYRISRKLPKISRRRLIGLNRRIPQNPFSAVCLNKRSVFENGAVIFLNEKGCVSEWNNTEREKLWLYNLHYFDDLSSEDSYLRTNEHFEMINQWISENPRLSGNGWEPYPTSLRIVNWIKWDLKYERLSRKQLDSLSDQAHALSRNLEYHILGNHLIANAKALVFAGLFFSGKQAESWLRRGTKILSEQFAEQILKDGGCFELSPMYHSILIYDVLDLISILECYHDPRCKELLIELRAYLPKMFRWLEVMSHPDGQISMFNDSAFDIAPSLQKLGIAANYRGIEITQSDNTILTHLEDSGFFRLNLVEAVLIADVGQVGASYVPGHGHADTLSFELSVFGKRLIVNSGTSVYGSSIERLRQRGTAAHSTVTVNDQNSSEVWSGFRVARRARPFDLAFKLPNNKVVCSHDGYMRLKGRNIHTRHWIYQNRSLLIKDFVSGSYKTAKAHFHFHPSWMIDYNDGSLVCKVGERSVYIEVLVGTAEVSASTYHPQFGITVNNHVLTVSLCENCAEVLLTW